VPVASKAHLLANARSMTDFIYFVNTFSEDMNNVSVAKVSWVTAV
jgi:hypothetical protein